MTANQIKDIVQSAINQARGSSAVTLTDNSDIVALGETMYAEGWQNDFLSALTDVIGKTIIVNRPYSEQVKGLIKDYFTFGAILRKLDVEPLAVDYDRAWTLNTSQTEVLGGTNDGYQAGVFVIKKPTVTQTLFNSFNVWSFEVTVPDVQFRQAFKSAEEMAAFIDAIMVALKNSIVESVDAMARMVYSTAIAVKCAETFGTGGTAKTAVNLLAAYNTLTGGSMTAAEALMDNDFIKFATKTINLYTLRMQDMSVLFNGLGKKRFTPKEEQVLTLNSEFEAAYESYLMSDTYHNEMVKLGDYTRVNFWQGTGTGYADNMKVNVETPSFTIGEATDKWKVSASGVIAILTDTRSLGVTVYDRYSAVERDNLKRIAQYKESANIGYYIDRGENGIVFLVADSNPTIEAVTPPETNNNTRSKK